MVEIASGFPAGVKKDRREAEDDRAQTTAQKTLRVLGQ
jgi:hypothetical protein